MRKPLASGRGACFGRQGIRRFVADLRADWLRLSISVEETIDTGEQVLAIIREDGVGRTSQVPITSIQTHVWTMHDPERSMPMHGRNWQATQPHPKADPRIRRTAAQCAFHAPG